MAAAGNLVKGLCDEMTCSVCLDYFTEPISLNCGHNICKSCLGNCRLDLFGGTSCPQCRSPVWPRDIRPNKQLANAIQLVKQLSSQVAKEADGRAGACEKHGEPLKLFCETDDSPICVVCDKTSKHRDHQVIPVEEALQKFKEKIQAQRQSLKQDTENLVAQKMVMRQKSPECLALIEAEKEGALSKLNQMGIFFDEAYGIVATQLTELKNKIEKTQKENKTILNEEMSNLSYLMKEIDVKCQQSPTEFLQNIKGTLNRYETVRVKRPIDPFPDLEKTLRTYSQTTSALVKKLLERQTAALDSFKEMLGQALNKVNVTLDCDTANPYLVLSKDLKTMSWGDKRQRLPSNPGRFDFVPCVLGQEGFSSGQHWWEVEVEQLKEADRGSWALGVATEDVKRKGLNDLSPNEGIWAVGNSVRAGPLAFTSLKRTALRLSSLPKKIRVFLDYEGKQVKFTSVDTDGMIFVFHSVAFHRKRLRPFFWMARGFRMTC
ncbi:zinc finger protein RFP-like [Varanus komodoensis]|uniref:RING-type E3 ubiquitin transferase n=1 Tax=Varanus komodoensis TaxID=61221 RepID=A0A8D2INL1_VARKO|nr:zinc finger protein RFP-like [Varanus komodoensis]